MNDDGREPTRALVIGATLYAAENWMTYAKEPPEHRGYKDPVKQREFVEGKRQQQEIDAPYAVITGKVGEVFVTDVRDKVLFTHVGADTGAMFFEWLLRTTHFQLYDSYDSINMYGFSIKTFLRLAAFDFLTTRNDEFRRKNIFPRNLWFRPEFAIDPRDILITPQEEGLLTWDVVAKACGITVPEGLTYDHITMWQPQAQANVCAQIVRKFCFDIDVYEGR